MRRPSCYPACCKYRGAELDGHPQHMEDWTCIEIGIMVITFFLEHNFLDFFAQVMPPHIPGFLPKVMPPPFPGFFRKPSAQFFHNSRASITIFLAKSHNAFFPGKGAFD